MALGMKLALVVIGDGRYEYLEQTVRSIHQNVLHPITVRIMVNDEANADYIQMIDKTYGDWRTIHTCRAGMAGAVQAGFAAALDADPDYVLWCEEDMLVTRRLPIRAAAEILDGHPHVAQILFQRQPLTPDEIAAGSVVGAMNPTDCGAYSTQTHIFSLNTCLIRPDVMRLGWPSGPLGVGNETGFTARCLDAGYMFGVWNDGPYVEHIGTARSAQWAL